MVKVINLPRISKVIVKNHIDVTIKIVVECSVCIIAVFVVVCIAVIEIGSTRVEFGSWKW